MVALPQKEAVLACPHSSTCALYTMFTRQTLLQIWKTAFCEGDFATCARYQRSACGSAVPINLLPNGKSLEIPGDAK